MIEPYTAVGLIPSFWGIRRREDIEKNLQHLESLTNAAFWLSSLDIPVRLVAIPERVRYKASMTRSSTSIMPSSPGPAPSTSRVRRPTALGASLAAGVCS
jgi:hypothetical protein